MTWDVFMKKLGVSFSDSVALQKNKTPRHARIASQTKSKYNWWGLGLFLFGLSAILFLLFRAFDLQLVNGAKNRERADANRIRLVRLRAPRGIIYDRYKNPLVRNIPSYLLKTSDSTFKNISADEALKIQVGDSSLGSVSDLELRPVRQYLLASDSAQLLGYLSEISQEELTPLRQGYRGQADNNKYQPGDLIGRLGVEQTYEDKLKGVNGEELIEIDALGKKMRTLGTTEPIPGEDLVLTMDAKLQQLVSQNYPRDKKGAVIVSDPQTGEILALYSSPSFDPNVLTVGEVEEIKKILNNPDSPMFNRTISGTYPSGSTFKIITASAGLESGAVTKDTQIEDTGEITIGPFRFPNWYLIEYGKLEGMLNIVSAIKRSNDIFFYKVGEMLGIDKLDAMAKRYGLGNRTGIDLPGEAKGLVPDNAWKQKIIGDKWYLGDTYHLAIGQGYLLATPLQMNIVTNVIASGGKLCRPHLLSNLSHLSNLCKDLGLKKETIDLITEGMKEVCSTGGTGWPFFDFKLKGQPVSVACKTGTAEFGEPMDKTHAWFTMFIPKEEAQKIGEPDKAVSVTVLVEGGGEGSNVAAPIAKKILEEWIK